MKLLPVPVLLILSLTWTTVLGCEDEALAVASPEVNPLYYNCSLSGGKYDPNSTYVSSLKNLADLLVAGAKASNFASNSSGNVPDHVVYGIALCRGDYSGDKCADGLRKAFDNAINGLICANFKDVTVYYDQYMLRFSGEDFRANLSNAPAWVAWNMNNATGGNADMFGDRVKELITKITDLAASNSSNSSPRSYATGEAGFWDLHDLDVGKTHVDVIYALVQCTPDINATECGCCLAGIASQMKRWFGSATGYRLGGRILGVRCNLRYEVDRFFEESPAPLSGGKIAGIVVGTVAFFIIIFSLIIFGLLKRLREVIQESERQRKLAKLETEIIEEISRSNMEMIGPLFSRYTLQQMKEATGDFSKENEIGKGGFGHVYQGKLPSGPDIAVKRLSVSSSGQGSDQFMNEIKLMATLQHRNLVRLLGFCIQNEENILVYEYMANGSLDDLLFSDSTERKSRLLNWSIRLRIIDSIAQGLLYLHKFARQNTCIVHRDIKANNILLDAAMNAKISDFGIAKIFFPNLMESAPTRGWGTFGYTAPEVFLNGTFSNKSDLYSFGVLVLEIVSGTKVNSACHQYGRSDNLLTYAWQLWNTQRCTELVDRSLISAGENVGNAMLVRYVQMALLCVQGNPEERPSIEKVIAMLSNTETPDIPKERPAYYNVQVHPRASHKNGAITSETELFYTTTASSTRFDHGPT
uniref:Protein kinase domain-containing protein n=1 Tax=Leersia perrieri TaxID=77586 RepID=A0A0D9V245_9ORYZ